jgi:hypothetical protein
MNERDEREPTLGEIDDFSGKSSESKNRLVNRLIIGIFVVVIGMILALIALR